MSSDSVTNDITESTCLLVDETDDSCRLQYIEIVPVIRDTDTWNTDPVEDIARDARDTDGPCTAECDSGDWSDEVKQETLPVAKHEPDDVCYVVCFVSLQQQFLQKK